MTSTDELLKSARAWADAFSDPPLTPAPALKVAILACMDARIIPTRLFGLQPGDAHVIRNAGGLVTDDAIRSLSLSQRKLGTTEIVLVHHTDCGLHGLNDEEFRRELVADGGAAPQWDAGGFDDVDQSVRDSIARIKASPFIPHTDQVRGFVYEVESGALREVT